MGRMNQSSPRGAGKRRKPFAKWRLARCVARLQLEQVPRIAVEIFEHSYRAVRFFPRGLAEMHAAREIVGVVALEIVRVQEEKHPPAGLTADDAFLLGVFR